MQLYHVSFQPQFSKLFWKLSGCLTICEDAFHFLFDLTISDMNETMFESFLVQQKELHHNLQNLDVGSQTALMSIHLPLRLISKKIDVKQMKKLLKNEFVCCDLDKAASYLWTLSTPSNANINVLHKQIIKRKNICVTKKCRLHLLWINDRIFIKPFSICMLFHAFLHNFLMFDEPQPNEEQKVVFSSELGFFRSYLFFIQHESDLNITQQNHLRLIPQEVFWNQWCQFSRNVHDINDRSVSDRYLYGEIRLSRLNLYAPLLFRRSYYEFVYGQYLNRFNRLFELILFVFVLMTIILNAMQVVVSVNQNDNHNSNVKFWPFFLWFSMISIFFDLAMFFEFVMLWLRVVADEWRFSYIAHHKRHAGLKGRKVEQI